MNEPVAWAVVFVVDEADHIRMVERMVVLKDHARAEQYAGDPLKPHEEPKRIRPLIFGDENE